MSERVHLVINAIPRTKKTSNDVVFKRQPTKKLPSGYCDHCKRGSLPIVLPSASFREYQDAALPQLADQWRGREAFARPVRVTAVFYREKDLGDLLGYKQALADILERAGVVVNDRWILRWGEETRMEKSAERPRTELTIEVLAQAQLELGAVAR